MEPPGIRNNNPGNLRPGRYPWLGQTFVTSTGYCVFESPQKGIRAFARQIKAYADWHDIDTIKGLVERWAPVSDHNNVQAYIDDVCQRTGFTPEQKLDFTTYDVVRPLLEAMIWHENGKQPYEKDFLDTVVKASLGTWLS